MRVSKNKEKTRPKSCSHVFAILYGICTVCIELLQFGNQ